MTSLLDIAYPVQIVRHDWAVRFVGNDTLDWRGEQTGIVDANGKAYTAPDLMMDTPWYHCLTCIANGVSPWKTRLSIGSKFCSECGTRLDWEHLERDSEDEAREQAAYDAKVELARISAQSAESASPAPSVSPTDTTERVAHSTNPVEMRARGER